ncbi:MAG TPA: hypothetical protein VIL28_01540 [Steroidobacteraceae bacterium]
MAWFVVRNAFGEVLELTPCADSPYERTRRLARAVHAWQQRGDRVRKLDELKYQLTSFDGNVRVLSIEDHRPSFRRDAHLRAALTSGVGPNATSDVSSPLPPLAPLPHE